MSVRKKQERDDQFLLDSRQRSQEMHLIFIAQFERLEIVAFVVGGHVVRRQT